MRTYKRGDTGIYHQTLNNAEAAYARVFGANPDGPSRRRVLVRVPVDLPPFSVVQLGTKTTEFNRVVTLEVPDNLSEGTGPCYTNHTTQCRAGGVYWLEPIDDFPSMLIVDGNISTGDTASVTDAGEATRGSGPLHCASEVENGFAWFVKAVPSSRITIQFPAGGIPASTAPYEPGEAVCKVLVFVPAEAGPPATAAQYKDTGRTETVYNWSADVLGDTGLRLGKAEFEDGIWQVAAADCEDEQTFVAAEVI